MKLLTETEAAIKLGITKELLYAYVKNAPKKHLRHTRKLIVILKNGLPYFEENEILDFDEYLKEPWSKVGDPRPKVPTYIQDYLSTEIGGQCPITGLGAPLDNAHIVDYAVSLNHHHHNLIRIAKNEHAKFDSNIYNKENLQEIKNVLIEKIRDKLRKDKLDMQGNYSPKLPNQLYIGQDYKLIELVGLMEYNPLILIQGVAGIGKTQLLLNALQNVQYHFPVLWIDVEKVNNIQELAIVLKEALIKTCKSSNEKSLVELLKDNQVSLVLDSLESLLFEQRDEVEEFLNHTLQYVDEVQIIITSQVDLSLNNFHIEKVKVLELDDHFGLELLKQSVNKNVEVKNTEWIIKFCSGHPLALKLTGQLINHYNSLEQVEKYLKDNGSIKRPLRKQHTKETALEVCFRAVYEVISDTQKIILQYLINYPGGVKLLWAEEFLEEENFLENLPYLRQFFFIEESHDSLGFQRVALANPLKPLLREVIEVNDESKKRVLKTVLENIVVEALVVDEKYIENNEQNSFTYGIQRLEDELPNLFYAFNTAQKFLSNSENEEEKRFYLQIVGGLSGALGKFCFTRGYYDYGKSLAQNGIVASNKLGGVDVASMQYMYLAQLQSRTFDTAGLESTINSFSKAAENSSNLETLAKLNWLKGSQNFDKGDFITARSFYNTAIRLYEQALSSSKNISEVESTKTNAQDFSAIEGNINILEFEIAKTYEFIGHFDEALKRHTHLLDKITGKIDKANLGSSYHHIAFCLCNTNRLKEGIDYYYKSIACFSESGQDEYLGNSIADLGRLTEEHLNLIDFDVLDIRCFDLVLKNLTYQITHYIDYKLNGASSKFDLNQFPFQIVSKIILTIQIAGFSSHMILLSYWSADLCEILVEKCSDLDKPKIILSGINLAYAVGGVLEWKVQKESKKRMLKSIYQSCLIINGGPDLKSKTRIFYWLAVWVNHYKLLKNETAETLWKKAWNSFDD